LPVFARALSRCRRAAQALPFLAEGAGHITHLVQFIKVKVE
jgi:hypothetical protein